MKYFKYLYNVPSYLIKDSFSNVNTFIKRTLVDYKYPELNLKYLCDPSNIEVINENIQRRKGVGNIKLVQELYQELQQNKSADLENKFYQEAIRIPNDTHPDVITYGNDPKVLHYVGSKPEYKFKIREFHELTKILNLLRTDQLGNVAGSRSYYFYGPLSELEQALIKYTVKSLIKEGFEIISVPDVLPGSIIESCGMNVKGERTQVYKLDAIHGDNLCLSGTSEMAIAAYLTNKTFDKNKLPKKIAAVSRCYRAEASSVADEKGIYRVHQFTKVEMFSITTPNESDQTLDSFREFQERHFKSLGLHFQVVDMPAHDLGAPAYRKYDIEAWLPGRKLYGEVSSCSNCTDYQSRRLNIKYKDGDDTYHVHTINGTACAVPRMLIALLETYQTENGLVNIPQCLRPYLRNLDVINRVKKVPELKLKKIRR